MLQVFATHTSTSWFWFRGCRYEVLPAQTFFQDFVQRNVKWSAASFPDVYCVDWTHLGLPLTFSSSCGFFQAFACSSLPGERKRTSYETERMRWVCQWMSPVCVCVSTCFILPSSWSGIVDPNLTLSYYSWVELTPKCSQASGPHCSVKSLGSREHGAAQILDQVTAR